MNEFYWHSCQKPQAVIESLFTYSVGRTKRLVLKPRVSLSAGDFA